MKISLTRREFALASAAGLATARAAAPADAEFAQPPFAARPSTYWVWLNGYTDATQLTRELEELKKTGFNAAYILEIAAVRAPEVPAGPAYMGPESIAAFGHVFREAARLGLEIGVTNASSWNSGGTWVTPEHASKGLYYSRTSVSGPGRVSMMLPFPEVPAGAPAFRREVAVLAVPEEDRLPGFDFLFDLLPGEHTMERVVFHNTGSAYDAREFVVFASNTGTAAADFREVLRGALQRRAGPQEFRFAPLDAKYLKLRILSGHDPGRIELAEFEGWDTAGVNAVALVRADGRKHVGGLLRATAEAGLDREWRAEAIYDSRLSGAPGTWAVTGPPPPRCEVSAVVDLTSKLSADGRLEWDAPAGRWSVYRFVAANTGQQLVAPSPKSAGLIIDHFSAAATRMHTEYMLEKLHAVAPDFRKSAFRYFYACSYEVRGSIWTPAMPEEFRRRRGYDMRPYLPTIAGAAVGGEDVVDRFRIDLRRTISDLFIENFYSATREVANRHGLQLVAEAGGPGWPLHQVPVDALKALGALDVVRGEYWTAGRGIWVVKETACAAHIYGKKIVQMEAFTAHDHWQYGPGGLKPYADRAFCEGMNHIVWHTMPHVPPQSGKPGWVYYAGNHNGPAETWWPFAKPFADYLARCSYLLRQGLAVADVCYYYGDRGFNFVQARSVDPSLGFGFDYDVTNADVILNRMSVKDGRIVLPDGMSYEVLVLPDYADMDLEVVEKLERLVREGATILGPKPVRATGLRDYPACDDRVRAAADRLWGPCDGKSVKEHRAGKGLVLWGVSLREALKRRGVGPDFAFTAEQAGADLDFVHRRDGAADYYFVRNRKAEWVDAQCAFRAGKTPELWDPVSGKMRPAAVENGRVALRLPPWGSLFVVFRPGARRAAPAKRANPVTVAELGGPWDVSFPAGWGAPPAVRLEKLISWTEHPESGVRYFSGTATYRRRFDLAASALKSGQPLWLDIGDVGCIAEVKVNGRDAGICWTAPYRVEITRAVRAGANELEIRVANQWSNRLTGDAQGAGETYAKTNVVWRKDMPLLPAGLLGPVRVLSGGEA